MACGIAGRDRAGHYRTGGAGSPRTDGPSLTATNDPDDLAQQLAARNIFVWSGHNYALGVARTLGILDTGGALRVGPVHYNSIAEIDDFLQNLAEILRGID